LNFKTVSPFIGRVVLFASDGEHWVEASGAGGGEHASNQADEGED
jgi:hypothetical protein